MERCVEGTVGHLGVVAAGDRSGHGDAGAGEAGQDPPLAVHVMGRREDGGDGRSAEGPCAPVGILDAIREVGAAGRDERVVDGPRRDRDVVSQPGGDRVDVEPGMVAQNVTGMCLMPLMKFDRSRSTLPVSSIFGTRARISSNITRISSLAR